MGFMYEKLEFSLIPIEGLMLRRQQLIEVNGLRGLYRRIAG